MVIFVSVYFNEKAKNVKKPNTFYVWYFDEGGSGSGSGIVVLYREKCIIFSIWVAKTTKYGYWILLQSNIELCFIISKGSIWLSEGLSSPVLDDSVRSFCLI